MTNPHPEYGIHKGMRDTVHIPAIMDDDLFKWMKENGYFEPMLSGKLLCPCGEPITEQNLTAMKRVGGKMLFYHSIFCATSDPSPYE